jgi:hypothetical protein
MKTPFLLTIVFLIQIGLLFTACSEKGPKLYIAPDPGDLSMIEGLEKSPLFEMTVNGQNLFVYRGFQEEYNKYGFAKKGGSFVNFAAEPGVLNLKVTTKENFDDFSIRPHVDHEKIDNRTILITTDKPGKFLITVWLEEKGENWFVVSIEEPEIDVPDRSDPEVLYLEAGVHQFERAWDPFQDGIKILYLEHGAVVQATIRTVGQDNLTLKGRGIFSQSVYNNGKDISPLHTEWMGDMMGIYFRECNNITIEGISVIGAPSYQIELADCEGAFVDNIKLLGFGEGNNDGIHLYGRNITLQNSFLAGSDDRICITGLFDRERFEVTKKEELQPRLEPTDVYNLRINNIVFWGHRNGADIMLTWNGGKTCRDVIIENVYSLGFTNKGFVASKHGGSVIVQDVIVRNAHLYHDRLIDLDVQHASMWGEGGGAIRNILLENITIDADPSDVSLKMIGVSEESNVENITFRNIVANGQKITSLDQTAIYTNEFATGIVFE